MRLIDADELIRAHGDDITNWDKPYGVRNKNIEGAPTIDPINHGKWITEDDKSAPYCSECYEQAVFTSGHFYFCPEYCPHCGAKMDLPWN